MLGVALQRLSTKTIRCKVLRLGGVYNDQPTQNNALDVLLGSEAVFGCTFQGVTKLEFAQVRQRNVYNFKLISMSWTDCFQNRIDCGRAFCTLYATARCLTAVLCLL
jgi:hypothetical protein